MTQSKRKALSQPNPLFPQESAAIHEPSTTSGFYSPENLRAIDEADERVKQGHYIVKTMAELEALADA